MLAALERPDLLNLVKRLGARRDEELLAYLANLALIWNGACRTGCDRSDSAGQADLELQ
jgi:hypothetical protein